MTHLPILDADAAVLSGPLDQTGFAFLIDLHILFLDLLGNCYNLLCSCFFLVIRQGFNPGLHRGQHLQNQLQGFFFM